MIGVCIPARDEERRLGPCLDALAAARRVVASSGERVEVLVVLDACRDGSARLCRARGQAVLEVDAGNVGAARHAGALELLRRGAAWLAFTDADSRVPRNWLTAQLRFRADAVCGGVRLDGWESLPAGLRSRFLAYRRARAPSEEVFGANLGVAAGAYRAVGGFPPLAFGEDRALVERLRRAGFRIVRAPQLRVLTSSRRHGRAPGGLGDRLRGLT